MDFLRLFKERNFRLLIIISLAFFLPVHKGIVPFFILLIAIEWIYKKRWKNGWFHPTYLVFYSLFFLYQLFSLVWSDNMDYGWLDISMKLSLIIFPILLGTKETSSLDYKLILKFLILGCLVLFVINISYAFFNFYFSGKIEEFYYSNLSPLFHVAYASMYAIFAISAAYFLYVKDYSFFKNIWITSLIVLVNSVHVVMLNSKASFIAMLLVYAVLFLHFLKSDKFRQFILPALGIVGISFSILFGSDYLYNRFFGGFEILKSKENQTISNNIEKNRSKDDPEPPVASSQVRVVAWGTAIELINLNPFGVGVGDRKDVFIEKVGNKGYKRFKEKGLNTHNQYLQVLLAIGFPGLMIFLINMFYPIWDAFRLKDFLFIAFIVNVSVNIMFESMLEVQAGIIFYAFFSILLAKMLYEKELTFLNRKNT